MRAVQDAEDGGGKGASEGPVVEARAPAKAPPGPPARKGGLVELGIGASWLLGVAAVLRALDVLLGASALGASVAGAVLVDLAADRAGVRWFPARAAASPLGAKVALAARRLGEGALRVTAVAALVTVVSTLAGWAHVGWGRPSVALALLLLRVVATAVRDELLYRGIPLAAAARAGVSRTAASLFAAAAGAAGMALLPGAEPAAIALTFASGWLFAALWRRTAWAAIGAHATWLLVLNGLLHGQLLEVSWDPGLLVVGPRATGAPAWLAAGLALAAGTLELVAANRRRARAAA